MQFQSEIEDITAQLTEWRRDFHQHPELGYKETRTAKLVAERLTSFGLEVHTGLGVTGVVGTLKGNKGDGPSLGLRADMDALPMTEETGADHASTSQGVFHGCGHDGHTTMLLGAAQALSQRPDFAGTVHFIFQPAEEGLAGAKAMMDDGLFERFPCDEVYGMHNWPQIPMGQIALRAGPVMAASDTVEIEIEGVGAHAAMPHRGVDPVYVASQVISGLQSLVSRTVDPQDAAVISITKMEGGSATNVIPRMAKLAGTCRTFKPETRVVMEEGIERVATNIAAAHNATAKVNFKRGYPPTVNHSAQVKLAAKACAEVVGEDSLVHDAAPSMGGEDFAFMLESVPGCYIWLGAGGEFDVHHPRYDFNDKAIPLGVGYWTELVMSRLG